MLRGAALPRKEPATYEDLLAVPEHLVAEIVDDELYTSPRPAAPHAVAASALMVGLGGPFGFEREGGPGGWLTLIEPELHIVRQIVVPDLAGWRRERMPEIPDAPFFDLAPDWLCEVVSPSTGALDRAKKMPHDARARIGLCGSPIPRRSARGLSPRRRRLAARGDARGRHGDRGATLRRRDARPRAPLGALRVSVPSFPS